MATVIADTPAHLLPDACFVCGGRPEAHRESGSAPHRYWSNADALAEAEAYDARMVVRSPEAAYVAEYRPY